MLVKDFGSLSHFLRWELVFLYTFERGTSYTRSGQRISSKYCLLVYPSIELSWQAWSVHWLQPLVKLCKCSLNRSLIPQWNVGNFAKAFHSLLRYGWDAMVKWSQPFSLSWAPDLDLVGSKLILAQSISLSNPWRIHREPGLCGDCQIIHVSPYGRLISF